MNRDRTESCYLDLLNKKVGVNANDIYYPGAGSHPKRDHHTHTRYLGVHMWKFGGIATDDYPGPGCWSELEIKHKHGGFNINDEKATVVVWQRFG
jgi:hypothetical protein